jgi:prepilin-type N-terminal cleavage/methylation domain-containing protein/prepilin-type processing-associated H-X9-DG protein
MRSAKTLSFASHPVIGRRAFSLVELLVALAILALVIALLLPAISKARAAAQRSQCLANLRQFAVADQMYINEWKDWHIPALQDAGPTFSSFYARSWAANLNFRRYLQQPIIDSTTPTSPTSLISAAYATHYLRPGLLCPTAANASYWIHRDGWDLRSPTGCVGMNITGVDVTLDSQHPEQDGVADPNETPQALPSGPIGSGFHGYKRSQVRRPSEKLMFCDALSIFVNITGSGNAPGQPLLSDGRERDYDVIKERTGSGTLPDGRKFDADRNIAWRHNDYANVVFFDGHGESVYKDNIRQNAKLWVVTR